MWIKHVIMSFAKKYNANSMILVILKRWNELSERHSKRYKINTPSPIGEGVFLSLAHLHEILLQSKKTYTKSLNSSSLQFLSHRRIGNANERFSSFRQWQIA
mgnify:CR=1 FL=1